ncbi:NAD(P)/FAD-dependent oxidoreductase [Shewanella waksmanii]|uniref:NAD(P)/FAD-dependent oxidoreductase n=1 Tax=Shewanella waksmanii TaxID=213783 RepID=UPI00049127B5|nr:FAD-dependent oxidoreductase [Shewanella waksmanii]
MKKIAIVGSGISGLTCAYLLDKQYEVTVFEKNHYVGGHTATVDIEHNGQDYAIDTGFIVFNDRTYPNFNRLLEQLNISGQKTQMSFSVFNMASGFEYNGHTVNTLFAQRRNIFKPRFWRLILEIIKFNKLCKHVFHNQEYTEGDTLGAFLKQHGFSDFFSEHYILPMGAAIWSTSLKEMKQFELAFFIKFFFNHGLLNITDRPQWYVVPGGSREYVTALLATLSKPVVTGVDLATINRDDDGVELVFKSGVTQRFDEVIMACHSDQALALLNQPSDDEQRILGGIPYSENHVVLHTDVSLLPRRRLAWASWNYQLDSNNQRPACVTYNMNILQGFDSRDTFCVTLNQTEQIDPDKILRQFVYHHPTLNQHTVACQQQRNTICGQNNTHFVGAYWYNGFHEDGVRSALDVTRRFGLSL